MTKGQKIMSWEECHSLVESQINAAVAVKNAGADGICLGGPYGGYFADQFATRVFNQRDDEYGYAQNGQFKQYTDLIRGVFLRQLLLALPPTYQAEGLWLEDAKKIKDAVNIPVVCPGKINTPALACKAINLPCL